LYLVNGSAIMTHELRAKLRFRLSRQNEYSVIQCAGRLVLEHGAGRLKALGSRELLLGRGLVVDLHDVEQMDARGLGAVATLYRNGLLADRPVVLVGVPARLRQLLKLTRLDSAPQRALCEVGSLSRSERDDFDVRLTR
jgi:anti-anti-sigma regulatory factor